MTSRTLPIIPLLAVLSLAVWSQERPPVDRSNAALEGMVFDPSGAAVRAVIRIRDKATGRTSHTKTDKQGSFAFHHLHAGTYDVEVKPLADLDALTQTIELANGEEHRTSFKVYPCCGDCTTKAVGKAAITLERSRSPLAGCEWYELELMNDGKVIYEGKCGVKVSGRRVSRVPAQSVKELLQEFDRAGYFSAEDCYGARQVDGSTTVISVRFGEKSKRVFDYYDTPKWLKDLEDRVDQVSGAEVWIGRERRAPRP